MRCEYGEYKLSFAGNELFTGCPHRASFWRTHVLVSSYLSTDNKNNKQNKIGTGVPPISSSALPIRSSGTFPAKRGRKICERYHNHPHQIATAISKTTRYFKEKMAFECCCTAYQVCVWVALFVINVVGYYFNVSKSSEFTWTTKELERSALEIIFVLAMDGLVWYTTPSDDPPASAGDCSPQRGRWYRRMRYINFVRVLLIIATVCGVVFHYLKHSGWRSIGIKRIFSALEIVCYLTLDVLVVINLYMKSNEAPSLEKMAFSVI